MSWGALQAGKPSCKDLGKRLGIGKREEVMWSEGSGLKGR